MSHPLSRRDALKALALVVGAAGAEFTVREARADALPHLDVKDPTAAALGYHESAKTVDVKAFPSYKPGQSCSTCLQLQGNAGDAYRPCNIYPGKLVNANGWCKVWAAKA
jgi:hypothetical protein